MEKLPLRPLVFVPAYLLLAVVSAFLAAPGLDIPGVWVSLLGLAVFALHFTWMFRALAYASKRRISVGLNLGASDPATTVLRYLVLMLLCFGIGALYKAFLQPANSAGSSLDKTIEFAIALPALYFLAGIFWIPARALCEAEMGRKATTFSIVGTAILFFYIFIGAPFIYQRLKKLNAPLSGGLAEPKAL